MPDTSPSDERLQSLRHRWTLDKTPRVLLQLADEYRKQSRASEAIPLLEEGLEEHPGHLSFQIAIGRCRLDMGDSRAAIEILEEVIQRDATQLVANKALLQAYLQAGDRKKAKERLLHYSLLASGDTDLEDLERQVAGLDESKSAVAPLDETPIQSVSDEGSTPGDPEFPNEEGAEDSSEAGMVDEVAMPDPFGSLDEIPEPPVSPSDEEIFSLPAAPPMAAPPAFDELGSPAETPAPEIEETDSPIDQAPERAVEGAIEGLALDPFGTVDEDTEDWNRALEAEGIFAFDHSPTVPSPEVKEETGSTVEPAAEESTELLEEEAAGQKIEVPAEAPVESESGEIIDEIASAEEPVEALQEILPEPEPEVESTPEPASEAFTDQSLTETPLAPLDDLEADAPTPFEAESLFMDEASLASEEVAVSPVAEELPPAPALAAPEALVAEPAEHETSDALPVEEAAPAQAIPAIEDAPQEEREAAEDLVEEAQEEVSATLGMLYLKQEHYGEARDIFSALAQQEPAGSTASRRLELLRPVPDHPVTAEGLLESESGETTGEPKARMLRTYLNRLRKRVPRRVP